MSAGPDGRYVRCSARDWGDALAYWWGHIFPRYCVVAMKGIGQAFNAAGHIAGRSLVGMVVGNATVVHRKRTQITYSSPFTTFHEPGLTKVFRDMERDMERLFDGR